MKKQLLTAIAAAFALTSPVATYASGPVHVTIDDEAQTFEVAPKIINDRVMVPMRAIFEALGASVRWEAYTQTTVATAPNGDIVTFAIGEYRIYVNDIPYSIDTPPQIVGDRMLVQARVVAQAMGMYVYWDEASRTVVIESPTFVVDTEEFAQRLFELVNEHRTRNGVPPLAWDGSLTALAASHSQDMANNNLTGIRGSDGSTAIDRAIGAGLGMVHVSGNASRVSLASPEKAFEQFIGNSAMANNILGEFATNGGFAVTFERTGRAAGNLFVVQKFGTHSITDPSAFAQIPAIADSFYINSMIDAGHSQEQIMDMFEREVFRLTNVERQNRGLHPLIWDDTLARAARTHSRDLAVNNMTGHTGSDGSSVGDRIRRAGVSDFSGWSENITFRSLTPAAAVESWMNSDGHRANILRDDSTHLGVGLYHLPGSQWETYTTQKFTRGAR